MAFEAGVEIELAVVLRVPHEPDFLVLALHGAIFREDVG